MKISKEQEGEELTHADEEWKQIKAVTVETEHAVGYHPKPDNRIWFDDDCKTAVEEKNVSCQKWINTLTSCRRLEYERLKKITHKICKNKKGIETNDCIKKTEENIKEEHFRNSYIEVGSLEGGFKPHTNLCKGTNDETISNED